MVSRNGIPSRIRPSKTCQRGKYVSVIASNNQSSSRKSGYSGMPNERQMGVENKS